MRKCLACMHGLMKEGARDDSKKYKKKFKTHKIEEGDFTG